MKKACGCVGCDTWKGIRPFMNVTVPGGNPKRRAMAGIVRIWRKSTPNEEMV